MRTKLLTFIVILATAVASGCASQDGTDAARNQTVVAPASSPSPSEHAGHNHAQGPRVPAFQADAASLKNLGPTLAAEQFVGKSREAYKVVKEIPQTIAQLPCYCNCDEGLGHKSLYSCYEDDHASHCAVCVDEALLAYKLQKEEKLTPEQIRERIIAQYSQQ